MAFAWRSAAGLPQLRQRFAARPHGAHTEQRRGEGQGGKNAGEERHGEQHGGKPWLEDTWWFYGDQLAVFMAI